jgi:3-oxoacyl-[acyl-carrier protein] reductase
MAAGGSRYSARTVVVTGSRKGLGKAIAGHFLAEGAQVVGISRGTATWEHERYLHLQADIGDDRAVRGAFTQIGRTFKKVDILVNNAAVLESIHALLMPAAKAEEMVRTNLLGTLFASREAAKLMQRAKWGRIINIGSMAVPLEPIGDSVYAATKAAATILAKELAGFGITCNTLGVSAYPTDMLDQLPRAKVEAVVASLPLPRMATDADLFNVIDFFASEQSGAITAQAVFLGGVHA